VEVHLKALDLVMLSRADAGGSISFRGDDASEIDVYLSVLYGLEERGVLVREKGVAPLRPFLLTRSGNALKTLINTPVHV
jgi:hypothetical protein